MAEVTCKKCRTEGDKLFLKGDKCFSSKCPVTLRPYGPGQQSAKKTRRRMSEYGEQLREKQKVKKIYGIMEKQFRNYYTKAGKFGGATGETLLKMLEKRLDNVVFKLGFADSRRHARELVSHNHIRINSKKASIASMSVKVGDKISFSDKFKKYEVFKNTKEKLASYKPPAWLKINPKDVEGEVLREPGRDDIESSINESLIVEFYSR